MKLCLALLVLATGCASQSPQVQPPVPSTAKSVSRPKGLTGEPSVTLAWDASVSPEVAGYRIYQGPASRNYTNIFDVGNVLTLTVTNFARGSTIFYAATAYATNGLESEYSAEISYTAPNPPAPPQNFRIEAQIAAAPAGPWQTFTNWLAPNTGSNTFYRLAISPIP